MIDLQPETRTADPVEPSLACASQSPAAASSALAAPLAALLDPAFLNRGEIILLALKPSLWFIPLTSGPVLAMITITLSVLLHFTSATSGRRLEIDLAMIVAVLRITWSILTWMGRLYLLTDLRLLRLGGVFTTDVVSCPLRKVAGVRLLPTNAERLAGVGSIYILPRDQDHPPMFWQTVAQPVLVQKEILAAISRASQSGRISA
jgi:hypothetical protein